MTAGPRGATPERATFAASAVVLLLLAGAIVALWVQQRDPAILTVEQVGTMRVAGGHSYLTAEVRNSGDETAEAVQVVAELRIEGDVVAEGDQSIDYLSGGEVETIVFIFDQVTPTGDIDLQITGYKVP